MGGVGMSTWNNPIKVSSTKQCPKCNNQSLVEIDTYRLKACTDCNPHVWIRWNLDKDQKPRH